MNASATGFAQTYDSAGPWKLAWRRLRQDRVAMWSLMVTGVFVAIMVASYSHLIAANWNAEVANSYAVPTLNKVTNTIDAHAPMGIPRLNASPPVEISDIDPLAPRYREWQERTAKIAAVQAEQATRLPFGADKW